MVVERHRLLSGRYEVEEELGRGGMARVYRARDRLLGRTVALKVMSPDLVGDPSAADRFRREARAAAGLAHPNVVGIHDIGSHGELHYIVMQHVEGETLADRLGRSGPLPPEEAARIASDVAAALQVAHDNGLVHRDVKPANVMVTAEGEVKVMDFGIARVLSSEKLTRTGTVFGTATYLSPEQARGDPVDGRSDIYSLGVVLYEMLVGSPPFTGDNPVAVAHRHLAEDPVPPSSLVDGVPSELEAVTMRALRKDPGERFASAAEMRLALAGGSGDVVPAASAGGEVTRPISPHGTAVMPAAPGDGGPGPETAPRGPGPRRRRRRGLAVLAALVAIVGLALLLLAGVTGPDDTGRDPSAALPRTSPSAASASPGESPSPSPSPSTPEELLALALADLDRTVAEGVSSGEVSEKAADEISKRVEEALGELEEGKGEEALERLADLEQKVWEMLEKGEITSEDRAAAIVGALEDVEDAVLAFAPGQGDDGSEGPPEDNPGQGDGKGKGNDEDDD